MQVGSNAAACGTPTHAARWAAAARAIETLAQARSIDDVVELLRMYARQIVGADGIAVILREGELCHYAAEDAEAPLWAGQRFPADACVSGWAMARNQTVTIGDVFDDPRVPQDAYRATFVKSMLMVPIGQRESVAAIGAYWSDTGEPSANEIALLEALARAASTALENGRLVQSLENLNANLERSIVERTAELAQVQDILREKLSVARANQLTGNVAHDFDRLLTPIMSTLDLILSESAEPDVVHRSATAAMKAAKKAKVLVQRLLASRVASRRHEPTVRD